MNLPPATDQLDPSENTSDSPVTSHPTEATAQALPEGLVADIIEQVTEEVTRKLVGATTTTPGNAAPADANLPEVDDQQRGSHPRCNLQYTFNTHIQVPLLRLGRVSFSHLQPYMWTLGSQTKSGQRYGPMSIYI